MRLVLNNVDDISISNLSVYRDIIFYHINDIKIRGLFFLCKKNMTPNSNRYIINLGRCDKIKELNEYFSIYYKPFLKEKGYLYIEVIKNQITEKIFNDDNDKICINFKSINDNKYPKIHILPWTQTN
jgi:hypothetical protein